MVEKRFVFCSFILTKPRLFEKYNCMVTSRRVAKIRNGGCRIWGPAPDARGPLGVAPSAQKFYVFLQK